MHLPKQSLLERWLRWMAEVILRYPRVLFYPQVLLFGFCVGYTVLELEFDTSRSNLVDAESHYYHRIFQEFRREFPAQDDLVVVVEGGNQEKNQEFVERLGARLRDETNLFTGVFFKGDLRLLGHKGLLFASEEDLAGLRETLENYRPFIQEFIAATNLTALFSHVNARFFEARQAADVDRELLLDALPALQGIVEQATAALSGPGIPPSPGLHALFGGGPEASRGMYITFDEGRIYLVTVRARQEDLTAKSVTRLRELVEQTQHEVPGLNVGITGEPVLEVDEMAQSQRDMALASSVALVACALIFIYGYRETGRPIKTIISLVVGLAYTMAFTTAVVGHLNILTITFVPILIGLAIDSGIHLVSRYEEELRENRPQSEALKTAMVHTGHGVFTGAFTTSGAFFAMTLTDFKGIQEMGVICGGGMLICLAPMLTLLPVLLLRGRQNVIDHEHAGPLSRRARVERLWLGRPRSVLVVTALLTGIALQYSLSVRFDYNLLNLQSRGLPAVVFEEKLIHSASKSVLYGAIIATNLDHALRLEQQLTNLPKVAEVDSMAPYLSEDQSRKLALVEEARRTLNGVDLSGRDPVALNIEHLSRVLWSLQGYLGSAADALEQETASQALLEEPIRRLTRDLGGASPLSAPLWVARHEQERARSARSLLLIHQLLTLRGTLIEFRKQLFAAPMPEVAGRLDLFQTRFFTDVRYSLRAMREQDTSGPLTVEDLPPALRNRFIGRSGSLLLQVYPRENIWEREPQREFIEELRTVDPEATGTPVQLYEYTRLLRQSYEEAAWYSLAVIALLVFIHFRSIVCVLLALLPVLVGGIWLTGFMGAFQVPFNPANIMTLPLVIGIGVTNGIHILHRFIEEQNPRILSRSTGKAILVSGLTTMAGFGSLLLAKHQGIASLGFVMAVGIATCMVAALTFLPALLHVLSRLGWKTKTQ